MEEDIIIEIFNNANTIAVVGLSPKPDRASHGVSKFLKSKGYKIIPVYPREEVILGEKVYKKLEDIKENVDEVLVFRNSDEALQVVVEAIKIKPKYIWLQEGIINYEAKKIAEEKGIKFIMDKCMYKEYLKHREEIKKSK